jgi:pimeloyl-ACP methyl ester carboxylesterase
MRSQLAILFKRLAERLPGTFNELIQLATLPELPEGAVKVPVLVIHGTADTMVPFDHATHIAAAIPGTELITIEGGGHSCLFTHIEQMRTGISGFLASLAMTPAPT